MWAQRWAELSREGAEHRSEGLMLTAALVAHIEALGENKNYE